MLTNWPVEKPDDWLEIVNAPQCFEELRAIRRCASKGRPYGEEAWAAQTALQLGIAPKLRPAQHPIREAY
jgi:hypothetical protein